MSMRPILIKMAARIIENGAGAESINMFEGGILTVAGGRNREMSKADSGFLQWQCDESRL